MDGLTLQQYLDMYKKPLTEQAVEAITALTEVTDKKQGRPKKSKPAKVTATIKVASKKAGGEKGRTKGIVA